MLSLHLKITIKAAGVLLVQDDQESLLSLPGLYKDRYTCSFKTVRDGRLRLQAWSLPRLSVNLEKVKHLCSQVKPSFNDEIALSYLPETGRFCIAVFSNAQALSEDLPLLASACDFVFPLFYEVADGKDCDDNLLDLGKYIISTLPRA